MGEKIRDLHSVKIGSAELMVELNEGNTKAEGRLIHVQNKHFRFLIGQKGFLELAATILRAYSEMQYYKTTGWKKHPVNTAEVEDMDEKTLRVRKQVAEKLQAAGIRYRFVDGYKRRLSWIVQIDDYEKYKALIQKETAFTAGEHPYGSMFGYLFLYQMKPFKLFEVDGVYNEVYFQLPCMSLSPKTWVPLDRMIQRRVWEQEKEEDGIRMLDEVSRYIYRLCYSVFKKNGISQWDRNFFDSHQKVLEIPAFRECLEMVFFLYTDDLIQMLKDRRYDEIIPGYYGFDKY